jgi:3',5'-cyclic AMP phosphodiesterase CpdA
LLIAQISDLHLGFVPDDPDEMNARRLDAVLDRLLSLPYRPDLMIATGDLVERGDEKSYRRLAEMLSRVPWPVHYALGNHDSRDGFRAVFADVPAPDGFVQYVIEPDRAGDLRLLVLDSLDEGRHGGAYCATRAAWLAARLDEAPGVPTLIVLHHPPFPTGIGWMTTDPDEPWVRRLAGAIAGHGNVVGLICGHIHRPIASVFAGTIARVCPATAPAVALTLEPIDPDVPDGRPMIVETPPSYAFHLWDGQRLVTHYDRAEPQDVIVPYAEFMRPLVRKLREERPGGSQAAS